jgi:hypothetical protein
MSQYPNPGYGQPFAFGYGPAPAAPAIRSARLGIVGLVLVAIDLAVVLLVAAVAFGIVALRAPGGSEAVVEWFSGDFFPIGFLGILAMIVCGLLGLAGWIIGWVAMISNRGRSFAAMALCIGVVIPFVARQAGVAAVILMLMS